MKNVELREVHIGQEIKKRLDEMEMTKTEFGRLIDTPQQHVNRIFNRDTIDTGKLIKICRALDFNFFALYCTFPTNISAYLSAVSMSGSANNYMGEAAVIGEMEVMKVKLEDAKGTESDLRDQISGLKDNVEQLKSQLRDKDEIINLLKNK
ncbi:MAG: helix-turn-helix domain-containing protein [Bacteroides sp.]|nr:helix-turn-helix domain-containing protein [Bacteroides sp.]